MIHFHDTNMDFAVITETWLADEDQIWLDSQGLKELKYGIDLNNRTNRRGGGIALIHKDRYCIKKTSKLNRSTFEAALWNLKLGSTMLSILGMYHPPFGSHKENTSTKFLDEFTDLITDLLLDNKNLILLGDLNVHLNRYQEDVDAQIFMDTLEALGLQIHNDFETHKRGNK